MFQRAWVLIVISGCVPAYSQVAIGVQGGVPLTDFVADRSSGGRFSSSSVTSATRRYTIGPSVEFGIRGPIGIEVGALYKRFGFDSSLASGGFGGPLETVTSSTRGNSVEFPIFGKLHLKFLRGLNGFVAAGPSIRHLSGISESGIRTVRTFFPQPGETATPYETDSPQGLNRRTSFGATLGGGLEFQVGPVRLSPGVRLTRWDTERTSDQPAASRLNRTQVDALLGIAYLAGDRDQERAGIHGSFGVGVLAAIPLLSTSEVTPPLFPDTRLDTPTRRFAAGAYVEWEYHPRFSVEAGFLTRRFGHSQTTTQTASVYSESLKGSLWEAPLLVKWRPLRVGRARVVVGGGPALRRVSNIDWTSESSFGPPNRIDGSWLSRSDAGFAVSGGLEAGSSVARVRAEIRYLRFERPVYDLGYVRARQDSLYFLLGIGAFLR